MDGKKDDGEEPKRRRPRKDDDGDAEEKKNDNPKRNEGWGTSTSNRAQIKREDDDDGGKSNRRRAKHFNEDAVSDIMEIPPLEEEEEADITTQVAAAPRNTTRKLKSANELDRALKSVIQSADAGIDLSLLTKTLVPPRTVVETDMTWTFDTLLQQVTQEFTRRSEEEEKALKEMQNQAKARQELANSLGLVDTPETTAETAAAMGLGLGVGVGGAGSATGAGMRFGGGTKTAGSGYVTGMFSAAFTGVGLDAGINDDQNTIGRRARLQAERIKEMKEGLKADKIQEGKEEG